MIEINTRLKTFGEVRELMKCLHDGNVSTSFASHVVWNELKRANIEAEKMRINLEYCELKIDSIRENLS